MARKARLEGEAFKADADVEAILAGVEAFKAKYPDKWDELRLCPLQHGIEEIAACLIS